MGECFHGWRRKVGITTLLTSLFFLGGWVRSLSLHDVVSFYSGVHSTEYLQSVKSTLVWQSFYWDDDVNVPQFPIWNTREFDPDAKWFDETGMVWRWQMCGFGYGEIPRDLIEGGYETFWFVPYWAVAVPLTVALGISSVKKIAPKHETNFEFSLNSK